MLVNDKGASVLIKDAKSMSPFTSGLEYSAPARGTWNIVHTGMLIPDSHQIFVCAQGCLRGVVLTAAEMGAMDRFSTIAVREENLLEGNMESLIIEGVSDILSKLKKRPKAVLVYTSCIHHFIGCDLELVYRTLRGRFSNVDFTDCYMNPIMRKSGLTPDQLMRRQLYSLLHPAEKHEKCVNIIGNNISTEETSELVSMIRVNGFKLQDICYCKTYDEYLSLAKSSINISYNAAARAAGDALEKRLGQKHLYLPLSYGYEEICDNLQKLSSTLPASMPDTKELMQQADESLSAAKKVIGGTPISIDYTATTRPLGLARLLIEHGFNVTSVYSDSFSAEEKVDFEWLKVCSPNLRLYATAHEKMRLLPRKCEGKLLAIGQKAAYFTGTGHFVNIVEGGGMYGFNGICRLASLMTQAFNEEKNVRDLIQIKGWGCCA